MNPVYLVVTNSEQQNLVSIKTRRGPALLGFHSVDDGTFYLSARSMDYCTLKHFSNEAMREKPQVFGHQILFLNTREAVELILQDPGKFPYDEFLVPAADLSK